MTDPKKKDVDDKAPPEGNERMTEKEALLTKQLEEKNKVIEKLVNVLNMIQNGINTLKS